MAVRRSAPEVSDAETRRAYSCLCKDSLFGDTHESGDGLTGKGLDMSDLHPIARYTILPSWMHHPVMVYSLYHERSDSWLEVERRERRHLDEGKPPPQPTLLAQVDISAAEVDRQLAELKHVRVPVLLECGENHEGARVQLEFWGANADLTLRWWTHPPAGCEGLTGFLDWLTGKLPDLSGDLGR